MKKAGLLLFHAFLALSFFLSGACKKSAEELLVSAAKHPETVEKLDLGLGKLGVVPDVLFRFPNLKWLDLRLNLLKSLPDNSGDWNKLEYLNVYGNDLNLLPPSFRNLSALRIFLAGNNDFERIPEELTDLPLEALYLDQNKLKWGEEDVAIIGRLHRLEILDISKNLKIVSLPKNIGALADHPKLRVLILKDTGLRTADVEIARKTLPKIRIEF
ncbi:leucine-rich repeat domain-containing protein [Leptospira fletcheri]|uniref:Leucine-rich repeat domain-containing protein n=1 Tax=Leptospira fletcheri TaxID=2484981 RepID=A0A4R9G4T3_9LEPT|nr:leucine-rich repeat domain-containing protein [Leptospira fletcheri]TGK06361.1 leucine-rich repeat domain-containing protein [Leptospira fletcheri]